MNDETTEVRLIVADDHPLIRQGLRQVIEAEPGLNILAEAGDGRVALEQIQKLRPALVILDIDMPVLDGLSIAREIRAQRLPIEIIFLTVHREEEFFQVAMEVGARLRAKRQRHDRYCQRHQSSRFRAAFHQPGDDISFEEFCAEEQKERTNRAGSQEVDAVVALADRRISNDATKEQFLAKLEALLLELRADKV